MSIVTIGSLKSSPGVTTTALVLAHVWPSARAVTLIECDPAGGDIAARYGRVPEPGLVGLSVAGRRELSAEDVLKHTSTIDGIEVVCAPSAATTASRAIGTVAGHLVPALRKTDRDVFIDCGRLDVDSPSAPLIDQADVTLLVLRPSVAEIARVAAGVKSLNVGRESIALVLIGKPSLISRDLYPAREVQSAVGLPVAGVLADDIQAAAWFYGASGGDGDLDATPLVQSARVLAQRLLHFLDVGDVNEIETEEAS